MVPVSKFSQRSQKMRLHQQLDMRGDRRVETKLTEAGSLQEKDERNRLIYKPRTGDYMLYNALFPIHMLMENWPRLTIRLEKFAKPWYKIRNLNIFRDESSLTTSPHLWPNIQKHG